jgi:hypothetical protein
LKLKKTGEHRKERNKHWYNEECHIAIKEKKTLERKSDQRQGKIQKNMKTKGKKQQNDVEERREKSGIRQQRNKILQI